jgi:hypothetical protein
MRMGNGNPARTKIDKRLVAQPINSGTRTIEPVAQMIGWQWSGGNGTSSQGAALVCIRPLEVRVREGEETQTIPLDDSVREAINGIIFAALAVSLFCWLTMLVAHWLTQRR